MRLAEITWIFSIDILCTRINEYGSGIYLEKKKEFLEVVSRICYIKTDLRVRNLLCGKPAVPGEMEQMKQNCDISCSKYKMCKLTGTFVRHVCLSLGKPNAANVSSSLYTLGGLGT